MPATPKKSIDTRRTVKLLKILSVDEIGALLEFGSYTCTSNKIPYYDLLVDISGYHPEFLPAALGPWEASFDKEYLNKALSELNNIIEEFLAIQGLRKDPVQKYFYITERLSNTLDEDIFRNYVTKIEKVIEETPVSIHKLYQEFRLQYELLAHWSTNHFTAQSIGYENTNKAYQSFNDTISLMRECERLSRSNILAMAETNAGPEKANPPNILSTLLEMAHQLVKNPYPDDALFSHIVEQFQKNHLHLGEREREFLFNLLTNFCNLQFNQGNAAYKSLLDALHTWAGNQKAFSSRWDHAEEHYFTECLSLGMNMRLEEMESAINHKVENLLPELREESMALMLAFLAFLRDETQKSLDYINRIKTQKTNYGLRVQGLLIRLHYDLAVENRDFEVVKRVLDNYRKYFERKDLLSESRKEIYMKLHYFINKMVLRRLNELKKGVKIDNKDLLAELNDLKENQPIGYQWLEARLKKG